VKITQFGLFLTHDRFDFPPLRLTIQLDPKVASGDRKGALMQHLSPAAPAAPWPS
jgi:hypothetical protein